MKKSLSADCSTVSISLIKELLHSQALKPKHLQTILRKDLNSAIMFKKRRKMHIESKKVMSLKSLARPLVSQNFSLTDSSWIYSNEKGRGE